MTAGRFAPAIDPGGDRLLFPVLFSPVAQLPDVASGPASDAGAPTSEPRHVDAVRRSRVWLSDRSKPLAVRTVCELSDACVRAYATCQRPVRTDLLGGLVDALFPVIAHLRVHAPSALLSIEPIASLGLHAAYPVDFIETLRVLRTDLASNGGFASPELATRVAVTLRDHLALVPRHGSAPLVEHLGRHLDRLVTVATSALYRPGAGHIAAGVGPSIHRPHSSVYANGVTLGVVNAPRFVAALSFKPGDISVSMDLDGLRTLMALFVGDPTVIRRSYRSVSLVQPRGGRPASLRIAPSVSIPCPAGLFLTIQSLVGRMMADPDYLAWTDFRASLFGDA